MARFSLLPSWRVLAVVALALGAAGPATAEPMVFGAASTARALDAALAEGGVAALTSYSASGTLARQIEQGAPADVFLSANPRWMAHLVERGLVDQGAVQTLMSNRLVLIAPEGRSFDPAQPQAGMAGELFVMADPAVAPVGRYGQTALETLGLWEALGARFAPTRNTLATVSAVASGEAALGLVYASDAVGREGIEIVWSVPADAHRPIRYLIAPLAHGDDGDGGVEIVAYLLAPEGQAVLQRHGFLPVGGADAPALVQGREGS
ncbi:MAG: molybdate ABC transporter substrate-binding protein [Pseudomonadota bacterium]